MDNFNTNSLLKCKIFNWNKRSKMIEGKKGKAKMVSLAKESRKHIRTNRMFHYIIIYRF